MTKEEILKQFQNDRTNAVSIMLDNPKDNGIYRTTDCYADLDSALLKALDQYATQIVLDKLPGDSKVYNMGMIHDGIETDEEMNGYEIGMKQMRTIATQRIITREEVEKPYKELLDECRAYNIPPHLRNRINQMLKP